MTNDELAGAVTGRSRNEIIPVIDEISLWSAPFGLRLLDTVRYRDVDSALDIGCGPGFPMIELAMRLGSSAKVFGVDPWKKSGPRIHQKVSAYEISNAFFVESRAERLPFKDEVFDLVVSNNGLNNVDDPVPAFVEISRVSRHGAQLVFSFNTDRTFIEFYEVFRETLYDLGLPQFNEALRKHIFQKRKPVAFVERIVEKSGFCIDSIQDDKFQYRFSNGTAFLRHFFIRLAFMESWLGIIPSRYRRKVFDEIETRLNRTARVAGELRLQVPFVVFDCRKL